MYDSFKIVNYSNSLVSPELYARHLSRLFSGDVIDGLTVIPGTGRQVILQPGNAFIRYGTANAASARQISLVDDFPLAIGTADASNPRIDLVVVYVDMSVTLPGGTPTSANLDGKGVVKAKIVQGTPNGNPAAPLPGAIQSSVGAGNPYTVVHQVRVDALVDVIAPNKITDVRSMAGLKKLTDNNGWTVYDYGTWKQWKKLVSGTVTIAANAGFSLGPQTPPTGVTFAACHVDVSFNTASREAHLTNSGVNGEFVSLHARNNSSTALTNMGWSAVITLTSK